MPTKYLYATLTVLLVPAFTWAPVDASPARHETVPQAETATDGPAKAGGIVRADDIRAALQKEGPSLDYSGQTIVGKLDLYKLGASKSAEGSDERVVTRAVKFNNAIFTDAISTWDQHDNTEACSQPRVRFAGEIDFRGVRFQSFVNLDCAVFDSVANFGDARFQKATSFTQSTFKGRAVFRSADFGERALFSQATFQGETDFAVATFHWLAFFLQASFPDVRYGANFLFTRFQGDALFAGAHFAGLARFVGTHFQSLCSFSDAVFEGQAHFAGGVRFEDVVSFRRARFTLSDLIHSDPLPPRAPVIFQGVIFSGDAHFAEAQFNHVSFGPLEGLQTELGTDTVFRQKADFRGLTCSSLDLRRVSFENDADFSGAALGLSLDVTDVDIGRAAVHLTWPQLLENNQPKFSWQKVFESGRLQNGNDKDKFFSFLETLEEKFRRAGQLRDAAEVSYLVSDLKRKQQSFAPRLLDTIFLKAIYGYGVSPWNQVALTVLIVAAFGFVYSKPGVLRRAEERTRRLRIAEIPIDWNDQSRTATKRLSPLQRYGRGFQFSATVFSKIGFGHLLASRRYAAWTIAEWVIGLIVWVLFLANLSNRWPLLHKLVGMVS